MITKFRRYLYNETKATKHLKVASTAMACARDAGTNRIKMEAIIDTIMQEHPDVDLVIFGEMILGWYVPGASPERDRQNSESIPGKTTEVAADLARKHEIYICFGLSELDGDKLHNAQVLLNPQGEIQAIHRKKNLKPAETAANYHPGQGLVTSTDIKGVKTGIVICADTASPQTMWALIRGRFDLIIHSLADDDKDDFVTKFQARMYDAWFVTANRFGQEGDQFWPGLTTVTDPLGQIRDAKQGQEQALVYELCFANQGSWLKRAIRAIWVKIPIILHVLRNWKQAKSYL